MSVTATAGFLKVIIHDDTSFPSLMGLCAGFECGDWRKDQLVNYLFNYLPEFALSPSEFENLKGLDIIPKIREVAKSIYQSDKFKNRGEFGELLLHAVLKEIYGTIPAISKIFYKDSSNDTVKGFDAVHVVSNGENLELWLGEVKFYTSIYSAIRDVLPELKAHTKVDFLRNEFTTITNKIDNNWHHSEKLKLLLNPTTSLDDVFECMCIPVLLTYDSDTLAKHERFDDDYLEAISNEVIKYHKKFCDDLGAFPLKIHLFLIPLNTKKELITSLHEKLQQWQSL